MQIVDNGLFIKAIADKGHKIFSPATNSYHNFILVGKMEYLENYKEVKDPAITYEEHETITSIINEEETHNFTQEKMFRDLMNIASDLINE